MGRVMDGVSCELCFAKWKDVFGTDSCVLKLCFEAVFEAVFWNWTESCVWNGELCFETVSCVLRMESFSDRLLLPTQGPIWTDLYSQDRAFKFYSLFWVEATMHVLIGHLLRRLLDNFHKHFEAARGPYTHNLKSDVLNQLRSFVAF